MINITQDNAALQQLPYLGKKTKPASLRKDEWRPMAMVEFPSNVAGLEAYRRLREFRRLHEYAYPLDLITVKEGNKAGSLMPTKQRGKVLMNQKSNTVADLAAVLLQFDQGPDDRRIQTKESSGAFWSIRRKHRPDKFRRDPLPAVELAGVKGVRIRWANLLDAGYAREWPETVVHHELVQARHVPAFPELQLEGGGPDFSEEGDDFVGLLPTRPEIEPSAGPGAAKTVPKERKAKLFPSVRRSRERERPRPKPTKGFRGQPFKPKIPRTKVKLGTEARRGRERIGAASWIERR